MDSNTASTVLYNKHWLIFYNKNLGAISESLYYIQLTEYEVGRFALYEVKSCCSFYIRSAIKVIDMWPERTRNLP